MNETKCNLCGECCHFYADGKLKKCKHLVLLSNGKTLCRIYTRKDRIGTVIYTDKNGNKVRCIERINANKLCDDCPFNELIIEKRKNGGFDNGI